MRDIKEFLSVSQVAIKLNVSKVTVYKMIKDGVLPAYRISGQKMLRIKYLDIINLLENTQVKNNPKYLPMIKTCRNDNHQQVNDNK